MHKEAEIEKAKEILGPQGRIISGSKIGYLNQHPDNFPCFNAAVCTSEGRLWGGDLDMTEDESMLIALAKAIEDTVYILRESEGTADTPDIDKHLYKTDGTASSVGPGPWSWKPLNEMYRRDENGKLKKIR